MVEPTILVLTLKHVLRRFESGATIVKLRNAKRLAEQHDSLAVNGKKNITGRYASLRGLHLDRF